MSCSLSPNMFFTIQAYVTTNHFSSDHEFDFTLHYCLYRLKAHMYFDRRQYCLPLYSTLEIIINNNTVAPYDLRYAVQNIGLEPRFQDSDNLIVSLSQYSNNNNLFPCNNYENWRQWVKPIIIKNNTDNFICVISL